MKKAGRIIGCLLAVLCIGLVTPALQARAEKPTAQVAAEMESEIASMQIDVPVTEVTAGWRYVPKLIFYPSSSTGLDTGKPISYSNRISSKKNELYYETGVIWSSSNEKVLSVTEHATGTVVIVAESEGSAVLTARLGKVTTSLKFEVSGSGFLKITGVEALPYDEETDEALPKDTLTVTQGEEFDVECRLNLALTPANGNTGYLDNVLCGIQYKDLVWWSSSDESVIDVKYVHNGGFKAMKPGKAVITVKAGNCTDSVTITVKNDPSKSWCSPVESDLEKAAYAEKYGKTIHSKQEVYQYVYDNLSVGNYEFAVIYPEEYLSFNLWEEFAHAIELYGEYVVVDERCGKNNETATWTSQIFIDGAREAIHYRICQEDSKKIVSALTKKADQVLASIIKKNMTTTQKLRAIHDYLVKNCDYDNGAMLSLTYKGKKYVNKNVSGSNCHTAYGALVEKKAVCEGYTLAFNLLARRAGIPCVMADGVAGGGFHSWNLVKVNGKYRYIDVTWDDPVSMSKFNSKKPFAVIANKKVYTTYFMVTDKKLSKDHKFSHKAQTKYYQNYYKYTTLH